MSEPKPDKPKPPTEDAVHTLRTIIAHRDYVRLRLLDVAQDLERRSLTHDISKLSPEEFDGFARFNRAAREHPYGSPEYRAGLEAEKDTIALHYARNSHHPEHGEDGAMDFLDIIEMVCDWRAAYRTYGSQGSWSDNLQRQRERYGETFSDEQWWLIEEVAQYLVCAEENRS